ncbi:unnamed protein product [Hermetia illucens]|uniref:Uncharacterized protein n=1 Tax=Hermetia illucens TaxID=343691 RepID=A0A7R8Z0H2_HERIL|nr:unnamed protein product [Hermetia illucens]
MLFDDSGFTRKISLLRNLISIRLENCTSMTAYVTQIVEAGQKLQGTGIRLRNCTSITAYITQIVEAGQKLQGTGFGMNDEWIGSIMLAGLSEKYMPMIMVIEHSGMVITTDSIKGKLMDMEPKDSDAVRIIHSSISQRM